MTSDQDGTTMLGHYTYSVGEMGAHIYGRCSTFVD